MSAPVPEPRRGGAGLTAQVEELYGAHAALVRSVCRNLLRNGSEAEDAVQQTFLSAQRALANGSSPREPAAWLATIARNECLARVQARMREPLPVDEETTDVGADAHTVAVRREEVGELRQALAELPDQQRDAILLRELRGLSYEEVAATLAVTTSAVESLIFRARRNLQTKLREALATLSPAPLLARVLGSGALDAPVAKVAAIGVGTLLVTGGALFGPTAIWVGHHAPPAKHAIAKPSQQPPAAGSSGPATPLRAAAIWAVSARPHPTRDVVRHETGDTSPSDGAGSSQTESSDTASGSSSESETSGGGSGGSSQETETTSSSSGATETADSTQTQTTSSSDSGSSSDGSGTSAGSTDTTTTSTTTTPDSGSTGD